MDCSNKKYITNFRKLAEYRTYKKFRYPKMPEIETPELKKRILIKNLNFWSILIKEWLFLLIKLPYLLKFLKKSWKFFWNQSLEWTSKFILISHQIIYKRAGTNNLSSFEINPMHVSTCMSSKKNSNFYFFTFFIKNFSYQKSIWSGSQDEVIGQSQNQNKNEHAVMMGAIYHCNHFLEKN